MASLKKIIGSLGRRYGGKPFQKVRKLYYQSLSILQQCREVSYMRKGCYMPGSPDAEFLDKYYFNNQETEGDRTAKVNGVICFCDGRMFHGGPTDRLRGILTTYREAKKRKLPFYISWTSPFPLEDYLVPADFDWRISHENVSWDREISFPVIIEDETNFEAAMRMKAGFNVKKSQLHFYSNADNGIGSYKELYKELFKPSEIVEREVSKHLENLGESYIGVTFRFLHLLGDFKEWSDNNLNEEDAKQLMDKNVNEFRKILSGIEPQTRVLVTSDSKRFLDYVKDIDSRIYIVPGDVKNIDLLQGEYKNAWLKTFVDQQLLMHASKVYLMRTGEMYKSGFPRFAAEVGGAAFIDYSF